MVVRLDSLKKAVCSFIETEILSKVPNGKKIVIGAMIMVVPKFIDIKYKELYPYISMMELGTEDGQLDIDKAEKTLSELMTKYGGYSMDLLGTTITFNQSDIHRIAELSKAL